MTTFGKYQVIDLVGEGGFGRVYRGQDPVLKRPVAIKTCTLLQADMRERFAREAEIAANLRHPNILTVYDFGEEDGEPYLVQEFLPGEDLDVKIRRADLIPLAAKIDWLRQVALGLRFAHENGVVHRDVKPSNIRILPDGQVRIMDFGIAKLMQADRQITQMGFSVGTTGYLAPEQLRGEEIDHRADIFSFGVLAYELITYRRPFDGESVTAILYRIANVDPPPLADAAPGCPPRLVHCIDRCLRKSRGERWTSLALVAAELDAVSREIGAIGDAAVAVGPTRAFEVVTGSGPARDEADSDTAADTVSDDRAVRRRTAPSRPQPGDGGRFRRSVAIAFALIVLATGVVGVVNVIRWAAPSPVRAEAERDDERVLDDEAGVTAGNLDAADREAALAQPAAPAIDTSAATLPVADRPDAGAPTSTGSGPTGRAAATAGTQTRTAESSPNRTPDPPKPGTGVERAAPTGSTAALQPSSILVVVGGGPEAARGVAESSLMAELLQQGFAPVEDRTSAEMAQRIAEIRGLGQRHDAGTVVFGDLHASAAPGVGRFFTGTATLTLRAYDANNGRVLGTRTFQVGAGGVPGKSAASEQAAITDAARAVAYQASRFVATLIEHD